MCKTLPKTIQEKEDNQSVNLTEEEKFIVIRENQKQWFHRN